MPSRDLSTQPDTCPLQPVMAPGTAWVGHPVIPVPQATTHIMATKKGQSQTERQDSTGTGSKQREKSARSTASEKTREEASRFSEKAKKQFAGQAEQQKENASNQLEDIGEALRQTSDTLHEKDKDSVANLTDGAAHQIERLSGYLRDRSVNEMLSEAKRFARRKPGMFLGGAAVLGFFGSRFFRSSDPEGRHHRHPQHHRKSRSHSKAA